MACSTLVFTLLQSNGDNAKRLQVNWPRLNTPRWANEGYQQALGSIRNDKFIGPFVVKHERGVSSARLGHLEEGKKRIQ